MSSPLGHALAGGILACSVRRGRHLPPPSVILTGMIIANIPDLDFIPGILLGQPNLFHHGISHSLGAAVLFTLFMVFVANRLIRRPIPLSGLLIFILYCSHLFLDLLSLDGRPPYGIPLLWPVVSKYFIIPVLPAVSHSRYDHASIAVVLHDIFSLHNLYVMGLEILLALPFLFAVFLWNIWYRRQDKVS